MNRKKKNDDDDGDIDVVERAPSQVAFARSNFEPLLRQCAYFFPPVLERRAC